MNRKETLGRLLLTLLTAVASCLLTEHLACRLAGHESALGDWSAAITGLLYGLTLPPGLPLWMVAVGGVFGVGVGKALFGGLGMNPFNPALVGRAFVQAAFPAAMTTWTPAFAVGRFASTPSSTLTLPFSEPVYDAVSGILLYLFLLVPFSFFAERLLFAFRDIRARLAGMFGIFLAAFAVIRFIDPLR